MLRRLLVVGILFVTAACGGGSPTASPAAPASPSAVAATAGPTPSVPPASLAASLEPTAPAATMTAICGSVGMRRLPTKNGALVVRVGLGTQVRAVRVVPGDPYTAGGCGTAGDTWLEIDQVDGKGVKALYGVPRVYAAAGFFN